MRFSFAGLSKTTKKFHNDCRIRNINRPTSDMEGNIRFGLFSFRVTFPRIAFDVLDKNRQPGERRSRTPAGLAGRPLHVSRKVEAPLSGSAPGELPPPSPSGPSTTEVPGAPVICRLGSEHLTLMHALLSTFGEAFEDPQTYGAARPDAGYLQRLLSRRSFIALVALKHGVVVGGLAAYELAKFEQARSEIYIYDLAVSQAHRRQGIATALIGELQRIAVDQGAWVVYVQADLGDEAAIALYSKLGAREDVLHFDIGVPGPAKR